MFIPTNELCEKIIKKSQETKNINHVLTSIILQMKPIRLDPNMIIKYCKNKLDKNNTWLFNNGNIKVVPFKYKKPVKLKEEKYL